MTRISDMSPISPVWTVCLRHMFLACAYETDRKLQCRRADRGERRHTRFVYRSALQSCSESAAAMQQYRVSAEESLWYIVRIA